MKLPKNLLHISVFTFNIKENKSKTSFHFFFLPIISQELCMFLFAYISFEANSISSSLLTFPELSFILQHLVSLYRTTAFFDNYRKNTYSVKFEIIRILLKTLGFSQYLQSFRFICVFGKENGLLKLSIKFNYWKFLN